MFHQCYRRVFSLFVHAAIMAAVMGAGAPWGQNGPAARILQAALSSCSCSRQQRKQRLSKGERQQKAPADLARAAGTPLAQSTRP